MQPPSALGTALAPSPSRCVGRSLWVGPWGFTVVVAGYVGLSTAYSFRLKNEPVVEFAVVASCYVLRAVAGGAAAHVPLSNWFLVFTCSPPYSS